MRNNQLSVDSHRDQSPTTIIHPSTSSSSPSLHRHRPIRSNERPPLWTRRRRRGTLIGANPHRATRPPLARRATPTPPPRARAREHTKIIHTTRHRETPAAYIHDRIVVATPVVAPSLTLSPGAGIDASRAPSTPHRARRARANRTSHAPCSRSRARPHSRASSSSSSSSSSSCCLARRRSDVARATSTRCANRPRPHHRPSIIDDRSIPRLIDAIDRCDGRAPRSRRTRTGVVGTCVCTPVCRFGL